MALNFSFTNNNTTHNTSGANATNVSQFSPSPSFLSPSPVAWAPSPLYVNGSDALSNATNDSSSAANTTNSTNSNSTIPSPSSIYNPVLNSTPSPAYVHVPSPVPSPVPSSLPYDFPSSSPSIVPYEFPSVSPSSENGPGVTAVDDFSYDNTLDIIGGFLAFGLIMLYCMVIFYNKECQRLSRLLGWSMRENYGHIDEREIELRSADTLGTYADETSSSSESDSSHDEQLRQDVLNAMM